MSVWLKKLEKLEEKLSQGKQKEAKHKNKSVIYLIEGFPGGSDGKESVCNAVDPGLVPGWEDPLEKGMATHSSILPWEIHGQRLQSMGL